MEKVVMILVDGMRPDGMLQCGHPFVQELLQKSAHDLNARTVYPSITLPCHMSLFHSVAPDRHGILSNTYVPQVRPIVGLADRLNQFEKKCAMFITWENLRDLSRPDHLHTCLCMNLHKMEDTDRKITDKAIAYIKEEEPDFLFLYLGDTDEAGGHDNGWMSDIYLQVVNRAMGCIEKVYRSLPEGYTMIVLADHGGHDRSHGTDTPEDMTIPVCICGPKFAEGKELQGTSILDIAPTVAKLLEVPKVKEWEGKELV